MTAMHTHVMDAVAVAARDWHSRELSDKIFDFSERAGPKAIESSQRLTAGLNVINHGDLWSNNVMFTNVDDRPTSAIILDFQGCFWGSPMIDMLNVLVTCSRPDLREADWNGLIDLYFAELNELLVKLKYAGPTVSAATIETERKRCGWYSLPMAFLSLAMRNIIPRHDDGNSFARFLANSDRDRVYREALMMNPDIEENMMYLLRHYDENGFFDL